MYRQIIASFVSGGRHFFDLAKEAGTEYDYTQTYIIPVNIDFYGIDENLDDKAMYNICDGDYSKADKVAKLFGYFILCGDMISVGYDPLIVCDDLDGDLSYMMSVLTDDEGPLNEESGDPFYNVFYIHELEMEHNNNSPQMFSRIINELPYLIKEFIHVTPEILAYYIAPLSDEWRKEIAESDLILTRLAIQKISSEISLENDNSILFAKYYNFSDSDMSTMANETASKPAYPKEYKDFEKFFLFRTCGFEELNETCLMYKHI